jgi:hopene-associated glycosyltransferase HpnB
MTAALAWIVGGVAVAIWVYLGLGHGRFWSTSTRRPVLAESRADSGRDTWPSVVAIVPARNEAEILPQTLPRLLAQSYPGPFRVIVVDDDSADGTGAVAAALGADVVRGAGPPPGWTGKVAAMAAGVEAAGVEAAMAAGVEAAGVEAAMAAGVEAAGVEAGMAAGIDRSDRPDYLLFTDADIEYPPAAVRELVLAAQSRGLVLVSQMVRLRTATQWERLIVPAFVYFFAQLFPFRRVNRGGRTAAAAGGCLLVKRVALERAGGLDAIRDAVIDDVALARSLKRVGPIWLGLAPDIRSVRPYPRLVDLWQMITRSAYTQLRYSPILLGGAVGGLLLVYVLPPALLVTGAVTQSGPATLLGGAAYAIMAATYVPIARFYRISWTRGLLLPLVALLYAAMTLDSARRYRLGRGAEWKGRVAAG